MPNIISLEFLEDELRAVVKAGLYKSKEEAIRHALEVLLVAHPHLRIDTAVELYRQSAVTLARATEIAGLEIEAFKEQLAKQNVPIEVDETPDDVHVGADLIHRLRETP